MTNNKPSSEGRINQKLPRRAVEPARSSARGKRIRVDPTRRQRVDPDMIALCYWLIAQRIVQEAADNGETGPSEAPNASNDHLAASNGAPGDDS